MSGDSAYISERDKVSDQSSSEKSSTWTIVLVDDQPEFLELAKSLLLEDSALDVVGVATSHEEAMNLVTKLRPKVVVHDVYMPGSDVARSTKALSDAQSEFQLVLMSSFDEPEIRELAKTIGAKAFLSKKEFSAQSLLSILKGD